MQCILVYGDYIGAFLELRYQTKHVIFTNISYLIQRGFVERKFMISLHGHKSYTILFTNLGSPISMCLERLTLSSN